MAKQLVSPIERHIDKIVLALAGLLLVGAIGRYLVTTPNKIEVAGEQVAAGDIDRLVESKATDVRSRLSSHRPEVEMPDRWAPRLEQALDPFEESLELPGPKLATFVGVPVPDLGLGGPIAGWIEPVPVVAPEKPVVVAGRSELLLPVDPDNPTGNVHAVAVDWATVAANWDIQEQRRRHSGPKGYEALRREVIVAGIDVQRRMMRPNGTWSDEDWVDVEPFYPEVVPGDPPPVEFTAAEDGTVIATKQDVDRIDRHRAALAAGEAQTRLIRPLFPPTEFGGVVYPEDSKGKTWIVPPVGREIDVFRQDEELLSPNDPPAPDAPIRYPQVLADQPAAQPAAQPDKPLTPQEQIQKKFADAERLIKQGLAECDENKVVEAYNTAEGIKSLPGATVGTNDLRRINQIKKRVNDIRADWMINPCGGSGRGSAVASARDRSPVQAVWGHDVYPGAIKGGHSYQWRLRVNIMNPYAALPHKLKDPTVAKQAYLPGEWSEPSDPVYIEPDKLIFLTGNYGSRNEVGFEFYQWFMGVWIRARGTFAIGDRLVAADRVTLPDLPGQPRIEFETDQVVLDIDFDAPMRKQGRGATRAGSSYDEQEESCEVILIDAEGNLERRRLPIDRSSPLKTAVTERVYKKPKEPKEKVQFKPPTTFGGGKGGGP